MAVQDSFARLEDTTSFFSGKFDVPAVVITICCALAIYNAIELLLLIFTTFRRFKGLYFWSLLIASFGVLPYTLGFMIEYFKLTAQLAGLILTLFGWPAMVTGQSLVLYSRLHVVLGEAHHKTLRSVLWMIIVNGVVLHVSTMVAVFGAYYAHQAPDFAPAYKVVEKIQMTIFTVQEFIISGLYVWGTLNILRTTAARRRTSRILWQLFSINVLIVIMDIALLVVEFQDRHVIEQAIKQVVYSVKLKMEFAILSKLVGIARGAGAQVALTAAFNEYDEFVDPDGDEMTVRTLDQTPCHRPISMRQQSKPKIDGVDHVEFRADSADLGPDSELAVITRNISAGSAMTHDAQRKRSVLETDLYASAMRDVG
nr:hypothetical protein B0A51_08112 [Rachicladosporium sp. CCFEE 5018]